LDISHELGENADVKSSSAAEPVNSEEGLKFAELVILCFGLESEEVHRISSMNSEKR